MCSDTIKVFKYLFSTFGLFNADGFFTRIGALLEKKKYNYDKFALEVVRGLVKAAPRLSYDDLIKLQDFLSNIVFDKHLEKFDKESYDYWWYVFYSMFHNRDLRRFYWVLDRFFTERLFDGTRSAYNKTSLLYFVANGFSNSWRYVEVKERVLSLMEQNLQQDYANFRLAISK